MISVGVHGKDSGIFSSSYEILVHQKARPQACKNYTGTTNILSMPKASCRKSSRDRIGRSE
jgi:hypothetical protein